MKILRIMSVLLVLTAAATARISAEGTMLVRARPPRGAGSSDLAGRGIEILSANRDGTYDMVVTADQLEWLRTGSPGVDILAMPRLGAAADLDGDLGLYHTYDEMLSAIGRMAADYPALTRLDTIATTHEGRLVIALKISDNAGVDESEAEVFIAGCHHARELMSVDVPLMFAEYLLSNYGISAFVTSMVDGREIWIAPMINPDGHVYVQNNHSGDWWNWWRKNRRDNGDGSFGVDLNRNYGYNWGYDDVGSSPTPSNNLYRGPSAFSEPETQAVRDFCASREFSLALSYHSYGELIIHPWGYAPLYTDDHEMFTVLGDSLSRGNGYYVGCTASNILYPANGDSDDWMYGETSSKNRIFSYTIELNTYDEGGFGPPDSLIAPTFEKVLGLNLTLLSRAGAPFSVLGPYAPEIAEVADLADPAHLVSWSGPRPMDPNEPIGWEVIEYAGYGPAGDPGGSTGSVWELDGFMPSSTRYDTPAESYYSGREDGSASSMTMIEPYPVDLFGDTLRCSLWFEIEDGWDYAYLELSTDEGLTWTTVPGDLTTSADPNGNNRGHGITGFSGGWTTAEFWLGLAAPLQPGSSLRLRFVMSTDSYINEEGIYIDDISPVPAYDGKLVLADSHPDTFLVRTAPGIDNYAYRVRAVDVEGHKSRWSSLAFHAVTDVTDARETPPMRSGLESVYPNPFNPRTTIRFTVGKDDASSAGRVPVRVEVFDVAGRSVTVLEDGYRSAGTYSISWDGRTAGNTAAASGIYFIRLKAGRGSFTRKTVLIR